MDMKKINIFYILLSIALMCVSCAPTNENNENVTNSKDIKYVIPTDENSYPATYSQGLKYELFDTSPSYASVAVGTNTDASLIIPDYYQTTAGVQYPITTIANYGFREDSNITSITWGGNITTFGKYCFSFCTGLTTVQIPTNVTSISCGAFTSCDNLTSVTYQTEANITSIYDYAFADCKKLKDITMPLNCVYYGGSAFYDTAIVRAIFPSTISNIEIQPYAFYECSSLTCIFLPTSVTKVGQYAFRNVNSVCTIYSNATNEDALKAAGTFDSTYRNRSASNLINFYGSQVSNVNIDDDALYTWVTDTDGAHILEYLGTTYTNVSIPETLGGNNVVEVLSNAFLNHKEITGTLTISKYIKTINEYSFYGCSNISNIVYADNCVLETIKAHAFDPNDAVQSSYTGTMIFPKSLKTIGDYAFYNFTNCTGISFESGSELTTIGANAFLYFAYYKTNVAVEVSLPAKLKQVSDNAFSGSQITKVTFEEPSSTSDVKLRINTGAFRECGRLSEVNFSTNVYYLGYEVFKNCKNLEHVYFPRTENDIEINQSAFKKCYSLRVYLAADKGTSGTTYNTITQTEYYIDINSTQNNPIYSGAFGLSGETSIFNEDTDSTAEFPIYYGVASASDIKVYSVNGNKTFEYIVDADNNNEITVTNYLELNGNTPATSFEIPATIDGVSVTKIGDCFAPGCNNLTKIKIPTTLKTVGVNAFWCDHALTYFGVDAISSSSQDSKFGTSTVYFGRGAFYYTSLTNIVFQVNPTFVHRRWVFTTIMTLAGFSGAVTDYTQYFTYDEGLYGGSSVSTTNDRNTLLYIPMVASGTLDIRAGTTSVARACGKNLTSITSITYPQSLTYFDAYSFQMDIKKGDEQLDNVVLGSDNSYSASSLTRLGASDKKGNCFYYQKKLTRFDFPQSLTTIGISTFDHCIRLAGTCKKSGGVYTNGIIKFYGTEKTEIDAGTSGNLTYIGNNAFVNCSALTKIFLPVSLATLGDSSFKSVGTCEFFYAGTRTTYNGKNYTSSFKDTSNSLYYYGVPTSVSGGTIDSTTAGTDLWWYYSDANTIVKYKYVSGTYTIIATETI